MMTQKILKISLIAIIFSLCLYLPTQAATGTYISESIGEESNVGFKTFEVVEPNIPSGAGISYSFAGSKDNYSSWSTAVNISQNYDLSSTSQLQGSKFMKVKINLDDGGNSANSPTLKGFKITYEKEGGSNVTTTTNISGTNSANGNSSISGLVSTGATLWFNILVALVIAGIIAYFILRRKPEEK